MREVDGRVLSREFPIANSGPSSFRAYETSLYWLLVFVPITVALEHVGSVRPPMLFFSAALAIIPIASMIVHATEQIASRTGDAVGGLLNATFGNAPELIIALVALKAGYLDMVRASLIGAILANLLLALGVSFLLGGIRYHDQRFNPMAARTYSTMMLLAALSMGVPSGFSRYFAPEQHDPRGAGAQCRHCRSCCWLAYGMYLVVLAQNTPGCFCERGRGDGGRS